MERKILQLADTTKAITLPRKWTIENSLKKGNTLEIEEHGTALSINAIRKIDSKVTIDVAKLDQDLIWRYLIAAYRKGTKSITIHFRNKKDLKILQQLTKDLLGMVVIRQYKNTLIMKDMFSDEKTNIDASLKKIFTLLIDLSDNALEAIKNNDKAGLENIPYQDFNINKFANLSIRLLNIHGYKDIKKAYSVYKVISLLEEIGDEYRRLSSVYTRVGKKVNKDILEAFEGVNELLVSFNNLYYKFDKEKLREFYKKANNTLEKLKNSYKKNNSIEVQILSNLDTILHLIKNLSEENMVIKL
ncbi:MAG: hypothetical protein CMH64_04415 [Nanoarchaeota archaeon]|nr:hypothetical protein [Nanoarchaeota archaeon]